MEKEDGRYCDFCSEPENPAIGVCEKCEKDCCAKHQDHGCPDKPIIIETNTLDKCWFCEKDKSSDCAECGKNLCAEHEKNHECKVEEMEIIEPSLVPEELDDDDKIIDDYNDKVEKENLKIDEYNKKRARKAVALIIIGFAIIAGAIIISNGINFDIYNVPTGFLDHLENNEMISDAELAVQCESWNIQGKEITDKYGDIHIDYWSEEDYQKAQELAGKVQDNCIDTKETLMEKLTMCTNLWVDLNTLIEFEMEERVINSLSEEKQEEYNEKYSKFFQEKCHVIRDEITSSEKAEEFYELNNTRTDF